MRVTRRTLRAAVVAGLVAGVALPASSAFASTAAPSSSASQTPAPSKSPDGEGKQDKEPDSQEYKLSNGAVAHVYKLPKGGYMAWITMNGQRIANLSAGQPTATVKGYKYELNQANGFVGVVHPDGWHSEQDESQQEYDKKHHKKDDKQDNRQGSGTGGSHHGQVPKGGVKAGAEGVSSSDGPDTGMLAAGGGMATAAAAGLGFAMKRRGRTGA
ncbi:hypothetical protein ACFP1Z_12880 [Streptomyces gamaensis]|uniref:Uncharacterized protein n=1 Tax=Streptomyces gamaensis TaxID=1763542 RepID=A0ABW0YZI9_9ACTN